MVPSFVGPDLRWPCLTFVLLPIGLLRLSVVVEGKSFDEVHRGRSPLLGLGGGEGKLRGGPNEHRSEMRWSCSTLLKGRRALVDQPLSSRPRCPTHLVSGEAVALIVLRAKQDRRWKCNM